jgi:polygalacturonase
MSALPFRAAALLVFLPLLVRSWLVVSITDYGAVGDNVTDNTAAVRAAFEAVRSAGGGGEVIVPSEAPPSPSIFKTGPFNISSNTVLTVLGTLWGAENASAFYAVATPPSYLSSFPPWRHHPFVWAPNASNVTIRGGGVLNGGGPYWWAGPEAHADTRPHLLELHNVTGAEVTGVSLENSAFWTFRPIYCTDVWIHDMRIDTPYLHGGDNTDGIDVDSSSNVLIERNYVSCGDDHFTVLAGAGASGRAFGMPSRNVTIRNNVLGTGMGMSIGSSVSGGVEGVTYSGNSMAEGRYLNASTYGYWGQGAHIKTRVDYGGYIRDIAYVDCVLASVSTQGILIETDYQSSGACTAQNCTEIRDIVFRNFTVLTVGGLGGGGPGNVGCYAARPCVNVSFFDVHVNTTGRWGCNNLTSGTFVNVTPPGLPEACGLPPLA